MDDCDINRDEQSLCEKKLSEKLTKNSYKKDVIGLVDCPINSLVCFPPLKKSFLGFVVKMLLFEVEKKKS